MYILKNALRSISRSIGRNILIGVIVLVVSAAACIGLSILRASDNARETALKGMTITAEISVDTRSMMKDNQTEEGRFDFESFKGMESLMQGPTLGELQTYASAQSVKNFYYTSTLYVNGTDSFAAVTTEYELPEDVAQGNTDVTQDGESQRSQMPDFGGRGGMGGKGGFGGMMSSDFTVIGYSGEDAMTEFLNGTSSMEEGDTSFMFSSASVNPCLISSELAVFNSLSVGDTVTVCNPNNEEELYELTVVGIYVGSGSGNTGMFGGRGMGGSSDPTNQIYVSAETCASLVSASETANADTDTTVLSKTDKGTYVFADVDAYKRFESEARALGMPEEYTVSSSDVEAFEQQLVPLETLGTFAMWFLIIVLVIGAIILVVLNLFSIRDRKYEVGVLTAIGMKKGKVAMQFVCEVLVVTLFAVTLGGLIGAVTAVPVTNTLLAQQVQSQEEQAAEQETAFGRGPGSMQMNGDAATGDAQMSSGGMTRPDMGNGGRFEQMRGKTVEYISKVTSATDMVVLLQLLGIGIALSLLSSLVSVIFIMRYDPLKILANRD